MSSIEALLEAIEAFLARSGMSATRFGEVAANDRHLVRRLRAGKGITLATADKVRTFISDWRPPKRGSVRARVAA